MGTLNRELVAARVAGWSLLLATGLFLGVFSYLAAAFAYPDVLDRPADEVLPQLLDLGAGGRAVWVVYRLAPLLLLPTAAGLAVVTGAAAPLAARGATLAAWFDAANVYLRTFIGEFIGELALRCVATSRPRWRESRL